MVNNSTNLPDPLVPAQVKAARALLGWSQADLARAAQLGPSTVADFERGERTPVANNLSAMRAALEGAGLQFRAGGAVVAPRRQTAKDLASPVEPVRWVDSTDLGNWADRRDGQDTLPELISRLLLAGLGERVSLRFPSKDSVQVGGWDGISDAQEGNQYVPEGRSGWEIGAQRTKIKAKADSDCDSRSSDPQGLDRSQTTFVFITPRRWKGKDAWEKKRVAEKKWKDVKAYDADDLVHWIELYPQVGQWLAELVGKRPPGLRQLDEVWREWSLSTRWPMNADLVLAGRDEEAARVLRWLRGEPSVLTVEGHSTQEAIAFLHAASSQLPADYRVFYQQGCLVAATVESARQLGTSHVPLTIVLEGAEPGVVTELVRKGHHVYLPHGSTIGSPDDVIRLPRPGSEIFSQALLGMGIEKEEASKLTRESTRSLSVLRRLIPSAPENSVPEWAEPETGRGLIPMLLAGAWSESQEPDRNVLEELSGESYDKISARLARWAQIPDSPFRRAGTTWKVASPLDVWFQLAPQISSAELDRFAEAAIKVLGAPDPRFQMKSEERWMSSFRGKQPDHSSLLRAGLAESLVLLSVYGHLVKSVASASAKPGSIVRRLLDGADAQRWWSVSRELRILAEAAPEAFLDALDGSLARDDTPVVSIFNEDGGPIGGAHHSELLWGLEELAWSSRYLGRAVVILGMLARLDPGGKYANRPKNSLLGIFRLWMPQTSVPLNERLLVLHRLRKNEPDIAWELMIKLLPGGYDVATPSPQSRWRDFATEKPETVTYDLIGKGTTAIATRLLEDAQKSAPKWRGIFQVYANLPPQMRERAVTQFLTVAPSFQGEERLDLWGAVRAILHHHRAFPDANWALPEDQLSGMERIYEALEPSSFIERSAWLFSAPGANLPRPAKDDWQEDERKSTVLRREVVQQLLASDDAESILALGGAAKMPGLVGVSVVEAVGTLELKDKILISALGSGDDARLNLAYGMIGAFCSKNGVSWAVEFLKRPELLEWPTEKLVVTLLLMPATRAVWDTLARFGTAVEDKYWSQIGSLRIENDPSVVQYAIEKFLGAKRSLAAIPLAGRHGKSLSSELVIRVLTQAAREPWPKSSDTNDATMFIFWIETLLKRLDEADDVSETEIARLEWQYLAVLEHSRRPPVTLHTVMAASPEFFVKVLMAVYGPSAEEEDGESEGVDAARVRSVAGQAFNLLRSWHKVPGLQKDSSIHSSFLEDWTKQVRRLCADGGIGPIGDEHIGKVLASSPAEADGVWPAKSVRELIETIRSREMELGILIGIQNNRGVTSRGLLDGGVQERSIAKLYRDWAKAAQLEWPRTSALLEQIAQNFEEHARWNDQNAERTDWSL
jgi:transcriptional regulator with XRE-family HTH domain